MSARNADLDLIKFPWNWKLSDLSKVPKNGRKVFSCFSCGGGSSMGYKLAGFDVVGCCEIDPQMMQIYEHNLHPRYKYLMDIREFIKIPIEEIPEELREIDILDGSPPCSTFSQAGLREEAWNTKKVFREGQAEQRLDDLFFYFVDAAKMLRPKVVIAENVKGLIKGNAKGWVYEIIKAFEDAGYTAQLFLLNSAKMGVPQKRERVFFIATRKDLNLPKVNLNFNQKPITFGEVRDAEGKPFTPGSEVARLVKYRRPGDSDLGDIKKRVTRKTSGFTIPFFRDDMPAYTVTAGGAAIRMCDGMGVTDHDYINCQTFPQDYDFMGSSVQYVCGMSVPPVMMANLASEINRQLFNEG